jgi:hypothetical protein
VPNYSEGEVDEKSLADIVEHMETVYGAVDYNAQILKIWHLI